MALIIFLIIFVFRSLFGRSSTNTINTVNLADYADTEAQMRFTVQGQINGDDEHRQIVITIGRNQRTLVVNKGYQGAVLKSQSLGNNTDAYNAFLHALNTSGFSHSRTSKIPNEQGQCPLGQRYIYEIINNGNKNMRTWSTSCNSAGTFRGRVNTVQQVFRNQFANYSEYTSDVSL